MKPVDNPLIKQGWLRAVIYLIAAAIVIFLSQAVGVILINQGQFGSEGEGESILDFGILYTLMAALIFLLTWLLRKFIDRKSFKSLGFTWQKYSAEAGLGFFSALALLGIGTVILVGLGYVSFVTASLNLVPLLAEVVIMVVVAFVEELMFRGYLLNNLMQSMDKWIALGVSAALFAIFHGSNPGITPFALVNIFVAGFLLGLNYIFTKNLWFGIFFHFAWNYYQGPVLGYEVSGLKLSTLFQQSSSGPELWTGGPFGFEGSLLCVLLTVIAILIFSSFFTRKYKNLQAAQ